MLNRCSFRLERLSSVKSKSSSRKKIIMPTLRLPMIKLEQENHLFPPGAKNNLQIKKNT